MHGLAGALPRVEGCEHIQLLAVFPVGPRQIGAGVKNGGDSVIQSLVPV
jgi:hypothetical protein